MKDKASTERLGMTGGADPCLNCNKRARRIFASVSGEKPMTVSAIFHAIRGACVPRTERRNYA